MNASAYIAAPHAASYLSLGLSARVGLCLAGLLLRPAR
jgi:hypothetical protein